MGVGWGARSLTQSPSKAPQRPALAPTPMSNHLSCLGFTYPPEPGTPTPLSWDHPSRDISKPTHQHHPSGTLKLPPGQEGGRAWAQSTGSRPRFMAQTYSLPPHWPQASRQPPLCNGSNRKNNVVLCIFCERKCFRALQNALSSQQQLHESSPPCDLPRSPSPSRPHPKVSSPVSSLSL